MIKTSVVVLGLAALGATSAGSAADPSPYAGWQERSIKALSPQQIEDYLAGRGMAMALPAELNGYPGPLHVLDLAEELDLTAEQRAQSEHLHEDMRLKAIDLGVEIVEREVILEELFASGTVSEASLRDTALAVGRLTGQLRAHHQSYHLAMRDLLDPPQIRRYQELRGCATAEGASAHRHGHDQHGSQ